LKLLNNILSSSNKYTSENTKGRNKTEFCIMQEFVLRYYESIKQDNKKWFLSADEALINNIEKLSF